MRGLLCEEVTNGFFSLKWSHTPPPLTDLMLPGVATLEKGGFDLRGVAKGQPVAVNIVGNRYSILLIKALHFQVLNDHGLLSSFDLYSQL